MKYPVGLILTILLTSPGDAMCVATMEHRVSVQVHACQKIELHASSSRPRSHLIHKRGSSIGGALVTGRTIKSTTLWDGPPDLAEYAFTPRTIVADESVTLFVPGKASQICDSIVGETVWFVTETPCCDVLPLDGLCLIPSTMIIASKEAAPV